MGRVKKKKESRFSHLHSLENSYKKEKKSKSPLNEEDSMWAL
jgi:hypothetical protein